MAYNSRGKLLVQLCLKGTISSENNTLGRNGKTDNTAECDRQKTIQNTPALKNGDGHSTCEAEEPPTSRNKNGMEEMGTVSHNDIDKSNNERECEESLDSRSKISDSSYEDPFAASDSNEDPNYIESHSTSDSSENEVIERHRRKKKKSNALKIVKKNNQSGEVEENERSRSEVEENKLTRKRKRLTQTWKRNKQRHLRLEGKEHLSQKGNIVRGKASQ
ncbi:uncharacterized protein isoform X2 [Leptinotarsa decemlineata]|uniref:uncharacterized protein isoform X2 n=1 Tax=Leptinotarsa decemlineata TaxID=7539 RepID=UPI003D3044EA